MLKKGRVRSPFVGLGAGVILLAVVASLWPPEGQASSDCGVDYASGRKRLLPIGDSITEAGSDIAGGQWGYRKRLQEQLRAKGIDYDMVGTRFLPVIVGGLEPSHYAAGGWSAKRIFKTLFAQVSCFSDAPAGSAVLLFAGTNPDVVKAKHGLLLDQSPRSGGGPGRLSDRDCGVGAECSGGKRRVAADNFSLLAPHYIRKLVVWGTYEGPIPAPASDDFRIVFRSDRGGLPGEIIESQAHVSAVAREPATKMESHAMFRFELTLARTLKLESGDYWIEVTNKTGGGGSPWRWALGNLSREKGRRGSITSNSISPLAWNDPEANDLAFRLYGTREDVPASAALMVSWVDKIISSINTDLDRSHAFEIFVALPIPYRNDSGSAARRLRIFVKRLAEHLTALQASQLASQGRTNIHIVDMDGIFRSDCDYKKFFADGVHPNTDGFELIAQAWAKALESGALLTDASDFESTHHKGRILTIAAGGKFQEHPIEVSDGSEVVVMVGGDLTRAVSLESNSEIRVEGGRVCRIRSRGGTIRVWDGTVRGSIIADDDSSHMGTTAELLNSHVRGPLVSSGHSKAVVRGGSIAAVVSGDDSEVVLDGVEVTGSIDLTERARLSMRGAQVKSGARSLSRVSRSSRSAAGPCSIVSRAAITPQFESRVVS